jgi:hypothetical protein
VGNGAAHVPGNISYKPVLLAYIAVHLLLYTTNISHTSYRPPATLSYTVTITNFILTIHRYTTSCLFNLRRSRLTFDIMSSTTVEPNTIYYGISTALVPLLSAMSLLMHASTCQKYPSLKSRKRIDGAMKSTSPSTKPKRATSFTKFGELPPELRVNIWQLAMPEARTVVVQSPYAKRSRRPTSLEGLLPGSQDTWQSATQIPALLHVNSEARYEALKHYSLSLGVGAAQPRIYVDFERDTVFFGDAELRSECSSLWNQTQDLDKVQRLAIVPEGAWRALRWKKVDLRFLQKLIFVHNCEKIKLGHLPELVEDEQSEADTNLDAGLGQQIQRLENTMMESRLAHESLKKRIQAARDEFNTLKMVLPIQWEKEPAVSTAVFREG